MKKQKVLLLVMLSIVLGCSKEESDIRLPTSETPIVTGFIYRDAIGNDLGTYGGVPNVKLYDSTNSYNSKYNLSIFPNPCSNKLGVYMKVPDTNSIKTIWIVEAQYQESYSNSGNDLGLLTKEIGGNPLLQAETTALVYYFDISVLPEGYYRVYSFVDDYLFYDNLMVLKSLEDN